MRTRASPTRRRPDHLRLEHRRSPRAGATLSGPSSISPSPAPPAPTTVEMAATGGIGPVVVLNRAPRSRPLLSPDPAYTNDTLTAVTDGFDPDGHDVDITACTSTTRWSSTCGPADGRSTSTATTRSTSPRRPIPSKRRVQRANRHGQSTAPVMDEVTLSPTDATEAGAWCTPAASDADDGIVSTSSGTSTT